MPSRDQYFDLINRIETLRERLAELQAAQNPNPVVADSLARDLAALEQALIGFQQREAPPPDEGLAQLIGLGPQAAARMSDVRVVVGVQAYDETVTSQRLLAISDLYYIYQHERIGIFRAILKLQELFKSGVVRLSDGPGALELYQYDRKRVLRYQRAERMQAYRRVMGYTDVAPPAGSRPNRAFHSLFTNAHFVSFGRVDPGDHLRVGDHLVGRF